jgi:hypothetical protein
MDDDRLPGADDPDLVRLGQVFRDELRAEAQAYEALAAKDLLRRRSLPDVARELVHRGDRVQALTGSTTFAGVVTYAAGDLVCLRTPAGAVDLRLTGPLALRVVERVRTGGLPTGRGPAGFTARLHEHEASGVLLELGCPSLGDLRGRIEAVAVDHVVLREADGQRCFVALRALAWVRPILR